MTFHLVVFLIAVTCLLQACNAFVALPNKVPARQVRSGGRSKNNNNNSSSSSSSIREDYPSWLQKSNGIESTGIAVSKRRRGARLRMTKKQQEALDSALTRRRHFLRGVVVSASASASAAAIVAMKGGVVANAAMKSDQKVFEAGKELTIDEAKARFKEGQDSLEYLLKNYDEICEGGGDNVRRYLGTVGTSSGLYGIAKVMKTMQSEAEDIVEYTEVMNEVNSALVGADGSAYMAIFTGTSTSGVPEEKYYGDAKIEIKRAIASMQELAKQMNIR